MDFHVDNNYDHDELLFMNLVELKYLVEIIIQLPSEMKTLNANMKNKFQRKMIETLGQKILKDKYWHNTKRQSAVNIIKKTSVTYVFIIISVKYYIF